MLLRTRSLLFAGQRHNDERDMTKARLVAMRTGSWTTNCWAANSQLTPRTTPRRRERYVLCRELESPCAKSI